MLKYAVVEIAGKQFRVSPEKTIKVGYLGDIKNLDCDKVLLRVEDNKIEVGKPYLSEKLKFEVVGNTKGPKLRVAKYKAKANTRKVKGFQADYSILKLISS